MTQFNEFSSLSDKSFSPKPLWRLSLLENGRSFNPRDKDDDNERINAEQKCQTRRERPNRWWMEANKIIPPENYRQPRSLSCLYKEKEINKMKEILKSVMPLQRKRNQ